MNHPSTMDPSEPPSTTPPATTTNDGTNRDSMVTVPLSDIQSSSENTQPNWPALDIPRTPVDPVSPAEQNHDLKTSDVESSTRSPSSVKSGRIDGTDDADNDEVDWAQLDRTEEQEPRGEDSDEVCLHDLTYKRSRNTDQIVNGSAAGAPRTGEQRIGYQSQVRFGHLPYQEALPVPTPHQALDQG